MSRRREILNHIADRLLAIGGVSKVEAWRQNSFVTSGLPAIAWRDRVEKADARLFGVNRYRLTVVYAAYLASSASGARELLAQMLAAIGSDQQHNHLARYTTLLSSAIGLQVAGQTVSGCQLQLEILYTAVDSAAETNRLQDESSNNLSDENGDTLSW
jgi:hypothetical protein